MSRRSRVRFTLRAVALTVLVGTGLGCAPSAVPRVERTDVFGSLDNRPEAGPGMNILLVGTDGRETVTPYEKRVYRMGGIACDCTDTMMLVHVSGSRDRVSVVSLPRDSYARIPAHRDRRDGRPRPERAAKLNAAYQQGGPALAVRTVERMTGVHIDRYLQLTFRSFINTVDTLGGVGICTTRHLKDPSTALDLAPGTSEAKGSRALQYVRSRKVDRTADFGRIQRQQRFLVGVLRRMARDDTARDPSRMKALVAALLGGSGAVRVDRGFSAAELLTLALQLRDLPPAATEFATVPVSGFRKRIPGVGETLQWDTRKSRSVFAALRADEPLGAAGLDAPPPGTWHESEYVPVSGVALDCG
ncbi:LCP family protein [Streptomyces sp. NBC_01317]|uniref:LCP family protein n=1 Tax=Streptomyces sp. NBC_01317 TaxID=2903822 RepID=UPI002E119BAA|nr:LCP family protein [Streptomyces sp. NBC_01317]